MDVGFNNPQTNYYVMDATRLQDKGKERDSGIIVSTDR